MTASTSPVLYQIHTALELKNRSRQLGRQATFDDLPDAWLAELAASGFNWLYLLGVWQTGQVGLQLARRDLHLLAEYQQVLPDISQSDICSSCFAITGYTVPLEWGAEPALQRLRQRLSRHGLRLMLDFIPNHTAVDHPWSTAHPDFYITGKAKDLKHMPRTHVRLQTPTSAVILAHGRDPYFPAWADTLQLNYGNPALQAAMRSELLKAAALCDGLRCDMAMLVTPEIFQRTWNVLSQPFWPQALASVKAVYPDFTFLAEVYWDLEATLLEQGFDFAYDKRLYDTLRNQHAHPLRDYLSADPGYQSHLARFLENHDEARAAKVFPPAVHQAAALAAYFAPGMRFFHQGQLEGRQLRQPIQLCRQPDEPVDAILQAFYHKLLQALQISGAQPGSWQLLTPASAWEGNWTWDGFIAYAWQDADAKHWLAVVNYSPHQSQCYLRLPLPALRSYACRLRDWFSVATYDRSGDELVDKGLFLDLPEWGYHLFEITISP